MFAVGVNCPPAEKSSRHAAYDTAHLRLLESELVCDLVLGMNRFAVESIAHLHDRPVTVRQVVQPGRRQALQGMAQRVESGQLACLLPLPTRRPVRRLHFEVCVDVIGQVSVSGVFEDCRPSSMTCHCPDIDAEGRQNRLGRDDLAHARLKSVGFLV